MRTVDYRTPLAISSSRTELGLRPMSASLTDSAPLSAGERHLLTELLERLAKT